MASLSEGHGGCRSAAVNRWAGEKGMIVYVARTWPRSSLSTVSNTGNGRPQVRITATAASPATMAGTAMRRPHGASTGGASPTASDTAANDAAMTSDAAEIV